MSSSLSSMSASSSVSRIPITYTTTVSGTTSAVATSIPSGLVPGPGEDEGCFGPAKYPNDGWAFLAQWPGGLKEGEATCNGNDNEVTARCCAQAGGELATNLTCGVDACKVPEAKRDQLSDCIGAPGGCSFGRSETNKSTAGRNSVALALIAAAALLAIST